MNGNIGVIPAVESPRESGNDFGCFGFERVVGHSIEQLTSSRTSTPLCRAGPLVAAQMSSRGPSKSKRFRLDPSTNSMGALLLPIFLRNACSTRIISSASLFASSAWAAASC